MKSICLNVLLLAVALVTLFAAIDNQVRAEKTFCFVRYQFTDEGCGRCCEKAGLIGSSDGQNGCVCIRSIKQEFMEKYPNVAEKE